MARKLPREFDDPVDILMVDAFERVQGFFKATHHTPNTLTAYSFAFGLAAVWAVWRRRPWLFAALYTGSLFFDCADGHFARTYGMSSKFGDYFDHAKDYTVFALLVYVIWKRRVLPAWAWLVLAALLAGSALHTGCQQVYHKGSTEHNGVLDVWKPLCPDPAIMKSTRFMGTGMFQAAMVALVAYHLA